MFDKKGNLVVKNLNFGWLLKLGSKRQNFCTEFGFPKNARFLEKSQ